MHTVGIDLAWSKSNKWSAKGTFISLPCALCGSKKFWLSTLDCQICHDCHPPPSPDLIKKVYTIISREIVIKVNSGSPVGCLRKLYTKAKEKRASSVMLKRLSEHITEEKAWTSNILIKEPKDVKKRISRIRRRSS